MVETPVFNKSITHVESIHLQVEVEALPMAGMAMGTLTGKVTVEMVMPAGMNMPGMKAGITKLGTQNLHSGSATFTLEPKFVVDMQLEVIYSGSKTFRGRWGPGALGSGGVGVRPWGGVGVGKRWGPGGVGVRPSFKLNLKLGLTPQRGGSS